MSVNVDFCVENGIDLYPFFKLLVIFMSKINTQTTDERDRK